MKSRQTQRASVMAAAIAGLAAFLCGAPPAFAQPSVGAAQSFAVLGGTAVSAAGTGTVVTGDVGVSPGTSITGFPGSAIVVPPFSTHANDGAAIAAQTSTTALYTTLAGMGGGTLLAAELGGVTLTPGVYSFTTTANIASGTVLTLTGGGTYIFKVGSALTANVLSNVLLLNGASACNIFWQVTSAATLNGTTFAGTVVAQAEVTLGVGAALSGRALTTALGAVTLSGGNTVGGCSAPGGGCPVISLLPAVLLNGTVAVASNQVVTASGGAGPYSFAVSTGALPAGLTLTAGGVLAGTPTAAGTFNFTIQASDANGCFATASYTVIIAAAVPPPAGCPVIALAPLSMPAATIGVAFNQTISGSGGTAPYSFGVTAGSLPAGLTLTAGGVLAGSPTAAGSSTFTVRATDALGCFAERAYTVTVATAVPTLPQIFGILLALALTALGYSRLRSRAETR